MLKCIDCRNFDDTKFGNCKVDRCSEGANDDILECNKFQLKQLNPTPKSEPAQIRQFKTGATRDIDIGKLDYEGFLSPLVLQRYAQYLHKHRIQSDGQLRDSDNWQKGIPITEYMKSKARHFMATWLWCRLTDLCDPTSDIEESLCAELFNTMGMLFEILKKKSEEKIES